MKIFVLLILAVFASENENDTINDTKHEKIPILVKIEEDEYVKVNKKSKYIGVSYKVNNSKWCVARWSKNEQKSVSNGCYIDEEIAAHASDTLARTFMKDGELNHKLNFPDDHIEIYPEEKTFTSKYVGVDKDNSKWRARRFSTKENKVVFNGYYDDEETAAHASDTLARTLIENDGKKLKLNFPDDLSNVYGEKKISSKLIGVSYDKRNSKWRVHRWSLKEKKQVCNGWYDDEKTAAHASDTLARKLMGNCGQKLKLNFPDDLTEVYPEQNQKKRKRPNGFVHTQTNKFI